MVGIVKKTNEFYEGNPYYKVKAFTYLTENQTIISKELITHAGVLKFKSSTPSMSMTNATIAKYNLDGSNFMLNSPLNEVLEDYNMAKNSDFSIKNKLIPVIATTLVIYNIFNIILIDMIRQIGILRTIGMSKKMYNTYSKFYCSNNGTCNRLFYRRSCFVYRTYLYI